MRSLPLTLLAAAMLLSPAAALAAPAAPAAAPARYFVIQGLVLGDTKVETIGKVSIDGGQLSASVGCNMIGGPAALDGDTVTILGPLSMTEMGCPDPVAKAEDTLVKLLALGTFKITDGGWVADGGQILATEIPVGNPGPAATSPDGTVSSTPGTEPVPTGPFQSCPPTMIDSGTNSSSGVDSGPVSGGGSGGGTTGSGGSSGSSGTGTATAGPAGDKPGGVPGTEPGASPVNEPGATGAVEPPPPAPVPVATAGAVEPDPGTGTVQPDPIGKDPYVGKPVDPCYQAAAGLVAPDFGAAPKASDATAELAARDAADRTALIAPVAFGLVVLLGVGFFLYRRTRATAGGATGAGDVAGETSDGDATPR